MSEINREESMSHMKNEGDGPRYHWDDTFPDEATANSMHKAIHGWDEWDKEHAPWIWSSDGEIILRGAIHISQDKANFILNALNQNDTLRSQRDRLVESLRQLVWAIEAKHHDSAEWDSVKKAVSIINDATLAEGEST